eukprot:1003205-Pleurochrysis_carterae.AAC.4
MHAAVFKNVMCSALGTHADREIDHIIKQNTVSQAAGSALSKPKYTHGATLQIYSQRSPQRNTTFTTVGLAFYN